MKIAQKWKVYLCISENSRMQKTHKKHYTIPVFIPEEACPHQCVFCNQRKITNTIQSPGKQEVIDTINDHLGTFPDIERQVEIGFFGGNFTGIPIEKQEGYLSIAQPFLCDGSVQGIRLSTRPDYISDDILSLLKKYNVTTIELGAQSMDDEVLKASGRGHTVSDTEKAAKAIMAAGFNLGLQMMIGLPGDTLQKSLFTAQRIIELGADNTRIYPTLVIKDTALAKMFEEGKYEPLSLDEAVQWSKMIYAPFEMSNVQVIRMGLHPSEGLIDGAELVTGPFHPSFRELVLTEIWHDLFQQYEWKSESNCLKVYVPIKEYNYAIGYHRKNKDFLLKKYKSVTFETDPTLNKRAFYVDYC